MDIVYIRDLKIDTVIGVLAWERQIRQRVSLDLEMATDISRAAGSDSLDDALDYSAVANRIVGFVESSNFKLIESLAEAIARIVMDEFNLPWVKLRLSKPAAVSGSRDVGVLIERGTART